MKTPKVCVWYVTAEEESLLNLSVNLMSGYDWVDRILVCDFGEPMEHISNHKVTQNNYANECGYGSDEPIKLGGFREIEARNLAIKIAEKTGCDWLLQCDSDEFYDYSLGAKIAELHDSNVMSVSMPCFRYWDEDHYVNEFKQPDEKHTRLWRSGLNIRYTENNNKKFMANFVNKQTHCVINAEPNNVLLQGVYHIHTHDLWPWKRREMDITKYELIHQPYNFPDSYRKAFMEYR